MLAGTHLRCAKSVRDAVTRWTCLWHEPSARPQPGDLPRRGLPRDCARFSLGFCSLWGSCGALGFCVPPFLLCAIFYTLLSLYFHRPEFCASQASSNFSIELSFWYVRILAVFSCFNLVDFSIAILVTLVLRPSSFSCLSRTAWLLPTRPGRGHVGRDLDRKSGFRNFHLRWILSGRTARYRIRPFSLINFEPTVCSVFDNKRLPPACLIWVARYISM